MIETIVGDPRLEIYPLGLEVVERMPLSQEIHDGIICATALVYSRLLGEDVAVLTKDQDIQRAGVVATIWE